MSLFLYFYVFTSLAKAKLNYFFTLYKHMNAQYPKNISPRNLLELLENDTSETLLIDVREDQELEIAQFTFPIIHLPLSKAADWMDSLEQLISKDKSIVVICHAGIRSKEFGIWVLSNFEGYEVFNLEGGIDAWSREIDENVPCY